MADVLILILLDDTLWLSKSRQQPRPTSLNPYSTGWYSLTVLKPLMPNWKSVLILILLDDTLWQETQHLLSIRCIVLILILLDDTLWRCFPNPGRQTQICLNPYSTGWYSLTILFTTLRRIYQVLILILLDDTLWQVWACWGHTDRIVLILILLDDTLWQYGWLHCRTNWSRLNPYSTGWYSLTSISSDVRFLVDRLNPYSTGWYSLTEQPISIRIKDRMS